MVAMVMVIAVGGDGGVSDGTGDLGVMMMMSMGMAMMPTKQMMLTIMGIGTLVMMLAWC